MSSSKDFEWVNFDLKAVWTALSKSTGIRNHVERVAADIESLATEMGRREAYDEGYYSELFTAGADSGNAVRRAFTGTSNARRNRRRRGQEGGNRLIDRPTVPGPDGKPIRVEGSLDGSEYMGPIGYVVNSDYKAHWVEYGSMAKGPRFILTRAAEAVAKRTGYTFDRYFNKEHGENHAELAKRISEGQTGKARPRKEQG